MTNRFFKDNHLFRIFIVFRHSLFWIAGTCFLLLILGLLLELFGFVFPQWLVVSVLLGAQLIWLHALLCRVVDIPPFNEDCLR